MRKIFYSFTILFLLFCQTYLMAQPWPGFDNIYVNGNLASVNGSFDLQMSSLSSFRVKFLVTNTGSTSPADYNNITVSFPNYISYSDKNLVSSTTNTSSDLTVTNYFGSEATGGYQNGEYVMIEGVDKNGWLSNEQNIFEMDVTPKQYGTFTIYFRGAATDQQNWTAGWKYNPSGAPSGSSGWKDCRGFWCYKLTVNIQKIPTIALVTTSLPSFGNVEINTNSSPQTYTVNGNDLTSNLVITAPTGFQISTSSGSGYSNTLSLTPSNGSVTASIYTRFFPTLAQSYSGNITHTSTGATTKKVSVSGTGLGPTITLATTSLPSFGNITTNTNSSPQTYTVNGNYLTSNLVITAPTGFQISTSANSGYNSSLTIVPTNGSVTASIYVKFMPTSQQTYSGNITNTSTGATTKNVAVSGTGSPPASTVGDISITLKNIDNTSTPLPSSNGKVIIYSSSGTATSGTTNSNGLAVFSNQNYGTFKVEGYHTPNNPTTIFGEEYWGTTSINHNSSNTEVSLVRNMPYNYEIRVINNATNNDVTGQNVPIGTVLKFQVKIKNPGSSSQSVKARLVVDQDKASTYDYDQISTSSSVNENNVEATITLGTTFTTSTAGDYFGVASTQTNVSNAYKNTNADPWGNNKLFGVSEPFSKSIIVSVDGLTPLELIIPGSNLENLSKGSYLEPALNSLGIDKDKFTISPFLWNGDANYSVEHVTRLREHLRSAYNLIKGTNNKLIVIGHSWGTFLTYYALSKETDLSVQDPIKCDLYITLSSPIGSYYAGDPPTFGSYEFLVNSYVNIRQKDLIDHNLSPGFLRVGKWINYWAWSDFISGPLVNYDPYSIDEQVDNIDQNNNENLRNTWSTMKYWHAYTSLEVKSGIDNTDLRLKVKKQIENIIEGKKEEINIVTTSLSFGNVTVNTSSSPQTYTLNGNNLTSNLVVTAPTGFQISTSANSGYSSSLSLPHTNGSVTAAIYAKFLPTSQQAYSGNITHTSTDATTKNVSVSGIGAPTTGAVEVTLPSISGALGSQTNVPITVSDLTGKNITSYQMTIYYDKTVTYLTGVDITGCLTPSIPTVNPDTLNGKLTIAWASAIALSNSGTLIKLKTKFIGLGNTSLTTVGTNGQTFIFNSGNPSASITSGQITTSPAVLKGDVDGNGTIGAYDASLVLQYVVGLIELSSSQILASDVDGNGIVMASDAAAILNYFVFDKWPWQ